MQNVHPNDGAKMDLNLQRFKNWKIIKWC